MRTTEEDNLFVLDPVTSVYHSFTTPGSQQTFHDPGKHLPARRKIQAPDTDTEKLEKCVVRSQACEPKRRIF